MWCNRDCSDKALCAHVSIVGVDTSQWWFTVLHMVNQEWNETMGWMLKMLNEDYKELSLVL